MFLYFDNVDIGDADEGGRPDGRHEGPSIWSRVPELHQGVLLVDQIAIKTTENFKQMTRKEIDKICLSFV